MSRFATLTVIVLCLIAPAALGATNFKDKPANGAVVAVDARYVFAPKGFDDNDESVVMVDGYLPSGCYRLVRPLVETDRATEVVTVTPQARFFDVPCVEALIPYSFEVQLGVLPMGDYTVKIANSATTASMPVVEATNAGPDDYLYAAVDSVVVNRDPDSSAQVATLSGRLTNSCMTWDEIIVEDNGKTINILPIIAMNSSDCVAGEYPFKKVVALPDSIEPGRHLLHVRSLNGRAVNVLFNTVSR